MLFLFRATSMVSSLLLSSTRIRMSTKSGSSLTVFSSVLAALYAGMTTAMRFPHSMPASTLRPLKPHAITHRWQPPSLRALNCFEGKTSLPGREALALEPRETAHK